MRYVWNHRFGRLAIALVLFGMIGLVTRYWLTPILLLAVPSVTRFEMWIANG